MPVARWLCHLSLLWMASLICSLSEVSPMVPWLSFGHSQLRELIPEARSPSGRALWSPNTVVVKPREVVFRLEKEPRERGVCFLKCCRDWRANPECNELLLADGSTIAYGHLFNCAGLQLTEWPTRSVLDTNTPCCPLRASTGNSRKAVRFSLVSTSIQFPISMCHFWGFTSHQAQTPPHL